MDQGLLEDPEGPEDLELPMPQLVLVHLSDLLHLLLLLDLAGLEGHLVFLLDLVDPVGLLDLGGQEDHLAFLLDPVVLVDLVHQ